MQRIIYCTFLKKKCEGLEFQLIPGELGKKIYDNISKEAWNSWQKRQTILINENKLNLSNKKDRQIIQKAMINYLFS